MVYSYTCTKCGYKTHYTTKFRKHLMRKTDCAVIEMNSAEFVNRELDYLEKCADDIKKLSATEPMTKDIYREVLKHYQSMHARAEFAKYADVDPSKYREDINKDRDKFIEQHKEFIQEDHPVEPVLLDLSLEGVVIEEGDSF